MLNSAIKNKFSCLNITEKGIENTAVFVNFLSLRVRVHTDMVKAGFQLKINLSESSPKVHNSALSVFLFYHLL